MNKKEIMEKMPGKDCGLCGFKTCEEFAEIVLKDPDTIDRCIHLGEREASIVCPISPEFKEEDITWKDHLGREYDFILDKFPDELGPRETVILFNPTNVEKLGIKKGDVLYGRPAWISCGCPVTHVGIVIDEPDYFNGTVVWCIVGPLMSRKRGINIGYYNTTAYEGIVKYARKELQIGRRYYFQPRYCMLQWRHCGIINQMAKTKNGMHVRIEGLWIG
ncbi:MAG: Fe-S cluster protein [Candidatus Helarchaeota archaeon]|nr:Fe-S cluster protein [Candidatus Helarchaeota archaeon]